MSESWRERLLESAYWIGYTRRLMAPPVPSAEGLAAMPYEELDRLWANRPSDREAVLRDRGWWPVVEEMGRRGRRWPEGLI